MQQGHLRRELMSAMPEPGSAWMQLLYELHNVMVKAHTEQFVKEKTFR